MYISTPENDFLDNDKLFYTNKISKLNYWSEMVKITFLHISEIANYVNKKLKEKSKSIFLKMAYEEVLAPVAFLSKKKYYVYRSS